MMDFLTDYWFYIVIVLVFSAWGGMESVQKRTRRNPR